MIGIPVFIRRLTAEEVTNENDASPSLLLDRNKEVILVYNRSYSLKLVILKFWLFQQCAPIWDVFQFLIWEPSMDGYAFVTDQSMIKLFYFIKVRKSQIRTSP